MVVTIFILDSPLIYLSNSCCIKQKLFQIEIGQSKYEQLKYYKSNKILGHWLKWKGITEKKKFLLALEIGFTDYILWNIKTKEQVPLEKVLHIIGKSGSKELIDMFITEKTKTKDTDGWNIGLFSACRNNNLELVNLMIAKGANDWHFGLYSACLGGDKKIIELIAKFLENEPVCWNLGLRGACRGENKELVESMIAKGANDWNSGLAGACCSNKSENKEIIELMITNGANDLLEGFMIACSYGNKKIVELIITKGVQEWNLGLVQACHYGNKDIVELMISKGANNWNEGLTNACKGRNKDIVELMIRKGANAWDEGLENVCRGLRYNGHVEDFYYFDINYNNVMIEIIDLMITKGTKDWNYATEIFCGKHTSTKLFKKIMNISKPTKETLEKCLHEAILRGNTKMIDLLSLVGAKYITN